MCLNKASFFIHHYIQIGLLKKGGKKIYRKLLVTWFRLHIMTFIRFVVQSLQLFLLILIQADFARQVGYIEFRDLSIATPGNRLLSGNCCRKKSHYCTEKCKVYLDVCLTKYQNYHDVCILHKTSGEIKKDSTSNFDLLLNNTYKVSRVSLFYICIYMFYRMLSYKFVCIKVQTSYAYIVHF